jgi:hypothetical protein
LDIVTLGLIVGLISMAYGQTVDNQTTVKNSYFSIDVPDNWTYTEGLYGMSLTPKEFGTILFNGTTPLSEKLQEKGAYVAFRNDWDYQIKNSGLDLYVKYKIDTQDGMKVMTQENATIDGEPAVKINGDGVDLLSGINSVQYVSMHNKEPYFLLYMANAKDFQKYLPEFEQIVKTFKFIDRR